MTLLARISRIENHTVRIHLLALLFPFKMIHFAWFMLWRDPRRLLDGECWDNTFAYYRAAMEGLFVE